MKKIVDVLDWIGRKKLRKNTKIHFGKDDIIIDTFRLNAVHVIPDFWTKDTEVDFYLDTEYDIYLLRIRNNKNNKMVFCPASKLCPIIYIVVEKSFKPQEFYKELTQIVYKIKEINVCDLKGLKKEIEFKLR